MSYVLVLLFFLFLPKSSSSSSSSSSSVSLFALIFTSPCPGMKEEDFHKKILNSSAVFSLLSLLQHFLLLLLLLLLLGKRERELLSLPYVTTLPAEKGEGERSFSGFRMYVVVEFFPPTPFLLPQAHLLLFLFLFLLLLLRPYFKGTLSDCVIRSGWKKEEEEDIVLLLLLLRKQTPLSFLATYMKWNPCSVFLFLLLLLPFPFPPFPSSSSVPR